MARYSYNGANQRSDLWIDSGYELEEGSDPYVLESISKMIRATERKALLFAASGQGGPIALVIYCIIEDPDERVLVPLRQSLWYHDTRSSWCLDIDLSRWSPLDEKLEDYLKKRELP